MYTDDVTRGSVVSRVYTNERICKFEDVKIPPSVGTSCEDVTTPQAAVKNSFKIEDIAALSPHRGFAECRYAVQVSDTTMIGKDMLLVTK